MTMMMSTQVENESSALHNKRLDAIAQLVKNCMVFLRFFFRIGRCMATNSTPPITADVCKFLLHDAMWWSIWVFGLLAVRPCMTWHEFVFFWSSGSYVIVHFEGV